MGSFYHENSETTENFLDANNKVLYKGARVLMDGEIKGVVKHCRYRYPKKFGFDRNQLPMAFVTLDDKLENIPGIEISTNKLEIID